MDYRDICMQTSEIARITGSFIYSRLNGLTVSEVEVKGLHNFVTEVDKEAERQIIEKLNPLVSGAGFIAEEGTNDTRGDRYNWVIDPLDGTTNFIHGAPPVAVSIALLDNREPVVGVVYEIWRQETFYTWQGGAAFLNGKEIRVSDAARLSDSLLATGFPYNNFDRKEGFMRSLDFFFCNTHGVRRLGSAATDLAYVACGRYDGFYEYNLNAWDAAAGALLVKQAGGKVSDFSGGGNYLFGREIVASGPKVFNEFLHEVAGYLLP